MWLVICGYVGWLGLALPLLNKIKIVPSFAQSTTSTSTSARSSSRRQIRRRVSASLISRAVLYESANNSPY
ncbi:unnamed protein product [Diplocarpon coronariae]